MDASSSNSKFSASASSSKHAFPSPVELDVASSLLLLSTFTTPPPPRERGDSEKNRGTKEGKKKKMKFKLKMKVKEEEEEESSSPKFTVSKSRLSSPASSTVTAESSGDQRAKFMAAVSKFPQMMKLKVVRKRRSRNLIISDCSKSSSSSAKHEPSASSSVSSCLSNGSSSATISSNRNPMDNKKHRGSYLFFAPSKSKPVLGSTHMRRRAEAILKILSTHGRASEVKIRELLGDSPSTSKALRILLNLEQVKRSGAGGRSDPYIYMIA